MLRFQPTVSVGRPSQYSKEWLIFGSKLHINRDIIEIAHQLPNKNCRFLVKHPGKTSLSFTKEKACRPGLNGVKGLFTISFDILTNRQQILVGVLHASANSNVFVGMQGNSLHVTNLRSKHMIWWKVNLNTRKKCVI